MNSTTNDHPTDDIEADVRAMLRRRATDVPDTASHPGPELPTAAFPVTFDAPMSARRRAAWVLAAAAVVLALLGVVVATRDDDFSTRTERAADPGAAEGIERGAGLPDDLRLPAGLDPFSGPPRFVDRRRSPTSAEAADAALAAAFAAVSGTADAFTIDNPSEAVGDGEMFEYVAGLDSIRGRVLTRPDPAGSGWGVVAITSDAVDLRGVRVDDDGKLAGDLKVDRTATVEVELGGLVDKPRTTVRSPVVAGSEPAVVNLAGMRSVPSPPLVLTARLGEVSSPPATVADPDLLADLDVMAVAQVVIDPALGRDDTTAPSTTTAPAGGADPTTTVTTDQVAPTSTTNPCDDPAAGCPKGSVTPEDLWVTGPPVDSSDPVAVAERFLADVVGTDMATIATDHQTGTESAVTQEVHFTDGGGTRVPIQLRRVGDRWGVESIGVGRIVRDAQGWHAEWSGDDLGGLGRPTPTVVVTVARDGTIARHDSGPADLGDAAFVVAVLLDGESRVVDVVGNAV